MPPSSTTSPPEPPPVQEGSAARFTSAAGTAATSYGPGGEQLVAFTISSWAIARYTLTAVMVIAGLVLLWKIQEVLLLLLLAILFATAIEPLVNWLRRGPFSRGQGILIVYSLIFGSIAAIGFLFVPSLVDQAAQFADSLPYRVASLRPLIEEIELRPLRSILLRVVGDAQPAVQRTLEQPVVPAEPDKLAQAGGALAHTLLGVVTVFLLAYYWLTERAAIKRAVLRLVPRAGAKRVNATWLEVEQKLGGWVRGQLLVMAVLGAMAGTAFFLLGLPNPVFLAVLAGLFEIIPMIGPFLAFLPALLVALTVDPAKALLLVPIALIIQQIEGNILIPRIMSKSVGVSPLTVVLGILIGSILWGAAGAFLAVPIAAAVQVILNEILRPSTDDDNGKMADSAAEAQEAHHPSSEAVSGPSAQQPSAVA